MQHQEFNVPEALQDTIHSFWYTRMDFGQRLPNFEVAPDGYAEIIFHFGSPCSILTDGGLQPLPSPFLMGLLGSPVHLTAQNRLEVIGVRCFPWTVFDLLGLPPSGKGGAHVFEHPIARLQSPLERFIQAGRINEAIAQVTEYFLNTRSESAVNDTLFSAGAAMREAHGTLPVSHIASAAHATVRTLERKFKQSSGYTVKDVSRLMRFEQARNLLWLTPDASLADIAQQLGYTDHAHLSREFKRYSGTTPSAFARKAKQEKQTASTDFVAFIQA